MTTLNVDRQFAGSIPQLYEQLLVPLIFAPYATDIAARTVAVKPRAVLEVAAGTGVATRELARGLGPDCEIVATDLNPPMLEHAASLGTARPVQWRQADAMQLPFADASFDAVVCQFGAMFFPDRARAYAEARRVLRPGGHLLFSVWDRIETNDFAHEVTLSLEPLYPHDPPRFLARTPHGYHDVAQVTGDLARAGFTNAPQVATITARSPAESARRVAEAYCQGTPLRNEIESRAGATLAEATQCAQRALAQRFGPGPVDGAIQAHVITVAR